MRTGKCALSSSLSLGVCEECLPSNKLPGNTIKGGFSIGYFNNGDILANKELLGSGPAYAQGDIVGCGINAYTREVFFTFSGEKIGTI